jgi:hypothetical protein
MNFSFGRHYGFHTARPRVDKQRYNLQVHLAMATSIVCLLGMIFLKRRSAGKEVRNEYHGSLLPSHASIEEDLATLRSERQRLLALLKSFEEQFETKHGRKVQSAGDFLPMAKKVSSLQANSKRDRVYTE